jgi:hypothetical protein
MGGVKVGMNTSPSAGAPVHLADLCDGGELRRFDDDFLAWRRGAAKHAVRCVAERIEQIGKMHGAGGEFRVGSQDRGVCRNGGQAAG